MGPRRIPGGASLHLAVRTGAAHAGAVFAIETVFDPAGEARIRELCARLAQGEIPSLLLTHGYLPHVSLAGCDELDPAAFAAELARFAAAEAPLPVALATLSTFGTDQGVLFLGATKSRALLELHERFWQQLGGLLRQPWPYYRPEQWVPHCTLTWGLDPVQLGAAIPIGVAAKLPIGVTLEGVRLVEPRG